MALSGSNRNKTSAVVIGESLVIGTVLVSGASLIPGMSFNSSMLAPLLPYAGGLIGLAALSVSVDRLRYGQLGNKFISTLKKINPEKFKGSYKVLKTEPIKGGQKIHLNLPVGVDTDDLRKVHEALELTMKTHIRIGRNGFNVAIEVMDGIIPDYVELTMEHIQSLQNFELGVIIGVDGFGLRIMEFRDLRHILSGGETGAGKTVWLRTVLIGLVCGYTPEHVHLHLGDLKLGVGLSLFQGLPHVKTFADDLFGVADMLEKAIDTNDERYALFAKAGVEDIYEYNNKYPDNRLPYHVVVVDEIADMNPKEAEDKEDKEFRNLLHSRVNYIGRKSRGAGIHLILSTQRPDADVIPGKIKANMVTKIGFKCTDGTASEIIIDSPNAAKLSTIPGRMILKHQDECPMQGLFVDKEDAEELVKNIIRDYTQTMEGEDDNGDIDNQQGEEDRRDSEIGQGEDSGEEDRSIERELGRN